MTGSHITNTIMVAPNSPINDVSQLPGKSVGLVLGSSSHYLLASVAWYHFGKTTEELKIRLVNMAVTEAIKMAGGIDAASVWVPQRFIGPQSGLSELRVDADGNTGKGHRTPGVRSAATRSSP